MASIVHRRSRFQDVESCMLFSAKGGSPKEKPDRIGTSFLEEASDGRAILGRLGVLPVEVRLRGEQVG